MNKPYHIVVWDCLNEVFGKEWTISNESETECCYESVSLSLETGIDNNYLHLELCIYWESIQIDIIDYYSLIEDSKGNYIEWDLYIWDNKFKIYNPDYGYDENPTFDNLETFKAFLEHNKRRFYNE